MTPNEIVAVMAFGYACFVFGFFLGYKAQAQDSLRQR